MDPDKMREQAGACRLYAKISGEAAKDSWIRAAEEWEKLASEVEAREGQDAQAVAPHHPPVPAGRS